MEKFDRLTPVFFLSNLKKKILGDQMNLCVNTSNITILCAYLNGCLKIKILPHFNDENILDFIQNVLKIIFFFMVSNGKRLVAAFGTKQQVCRGIKIELN